MENNNNKNNKEESDWKEHKLLILSKLSSLENSIRDLSTVVYTSNKDMKELINADRLKLSEFMSTMKEMVQRDSTNIERLTSKVDDQDKELHDMTLKFKLYSGIIFFLSGPIWYYVFNKYMVLK